MGAWSHDSFGNDDACDWGAQLADSEGLELIEAALDVVLATGGKYLEAPPASEAIAAAEVVARLQGNFGVRDAYSEDVDAWVGSTKLRPSRALATKAQRVLDRILTQPSELLELWQESQEADAWAGAVRNLKDRIHD